MNAGESLIQTAVDAGVEVCFANPGTTEMELVKAIDQVAGMRPILGLFEGVCTAASDGYGRLAGKPAMNLLHLGPGFANGIANLHNARRARTPIVNVIGDQASWHLAADAPLTSDIESLARPVSGWVRTSTSAQGLAGDMADAVAASYENGGQVATLIVPADFCAEDVSGGASIKAIPGPNPVAQDAVEAVAKALRENSPGAILLGDTGCTRRSIVAAQRISEATGCKLYHETFVRQLARGAGIPKVDRLPYFPEFVMGLLGMTKTLVLAGSREPVAFFGYKGHPSILVPEGCTPVPLARPGDDIAGALEAVAEALGAPAEGYKTVEASKPGKPSGALAPDTVGMIANLLMPEGTIVMDEALTSSDLALTPMQTAAPHEVLHLTGGAIGQGIPTATGAAVACPDRKVLSLQSDGAGMYTLQGLWTQAREALDVKTIIFNNGTYKILQLELMRAGVTERGPGAEGLTDLGHPSLQWTKLAEGLGVPATRATTAEELYDALEATMGEPGPHLIEAIVP